jgi:hypothetical protein
MAVDVGTPRSRRALLLASLGGAAAVVAQAVGRPLPVRAAGSDGTPMVVGGQYLDARTETKIVNTSPNNGSNPNTRAMWLQASGTALLTQAGYTGLFASAPTYGATAWGTSVTDGVGFYGLAGNSGPSNPVDRPTGVLGRTSTDIDGYGVRGRSELGVGVRGESVSGYGVWGVSSSAYGVAATSTSNAAVSAINSAAGRAAVEAFNNGGGIALLGITGGPVAVQPKKTGVYGESYIDADSRGVFGRSGVGRGVTGIATTGRGVHGQASTGVGVYATATSATGTALQVAGKAVFDRSGSVTFTTGQSFRDVSVAGMTASSLVLVTIQTNRAGLAVQSAVPRAGAFRIYLNKAVTGSTKVAWFALG